MSPSKRKSCRRPLKVAAFLYTLDGWPLGECKMHDISEGGAKLALGDIEDAPDELLLSLCRDGRVRRHCQIMWRADNTVGVRFSQIEQPSR